MKFDPQFLAFVVFIVSIANLLLVGFGYLIFNEMKNILQEMDTVDLGLPVKSETPKEPLPPFFHSRPKRHKVTHHTDRSQWEIETKKRNKHNDI